jgi:HEPN domain-containing protein
LSTAGEWNTLNPEGAVAERSADWFRQAERDLESARAQERDGFYEWACFIAQQAAEKALKAVFQKNGAEAWGHSLAELLKALPVSTDVTGSIREAALALDRFYIPSRYPTGWAEGTPSQFISREDARNSIDNSQAIIRLCHDLLAR